jgi:MATE family multidrug resistance protein
VPNQTTPTAPTRSRILRIAWPIVLANCAEPLLGLVDTAVIGNTGSVEELGAIALGALVFSFVYWGFGFLRMGTTGFTAQAAGAGDEPEVRASQGRALAAAVGLGAVIVLLQWPIAWASLALLDGSPDVELITRDYILIRIWGAPAALAVFTVSGTLIGLGKTRTLLIVQVFLNGVNIALDVFFAGMLGWGANGIALGTAIAGWGALGLSLFFIARILRERHTDDEPFWPIARIRDRAKLFGTVRVNTDIMIRTLFLLFSFAWFTNQGARYGDIVLAANHLLLQLISFSAFFLDGFAFATESIVGTAVGSKSRDVFDAAVRHSTHLAAGTAILLAASIGLFGDAAVRVLTNLPIVREAATSYLPLAAAYVLLSFPAFQLDGIFIGATRTRDMRNAAALSTLTFLTAWWLLAIPYGNTGLWVAFIVYLVARAVALMIFFPGLRTAIRIAPG